MNEQNPGYTVGKWHDHENYECTSCPYATIDRTAIELHVARHAAGARVVPRYEEPPEPEQEPPPALD